VTGGNSPAQEEKAGMTIRYGGYVFDAPAPVARWSAPHRAGVYAILVADQRCQPMPFRVIYFGESGNMSERGFLKGHPKYSCCVREAGSEQSLYIAVYPMPESTPEQRRAVADVLISEIGPVCNKP
jgi:hypothetical protein